MGCVFFIYDKKYGKDLINNAPENFNKVKEIFNNFNEIMFVKYIFISIFNTMTNNDKKFHCAFE